VSNDLFLDDKICLASVLVFGWLVRQGFDLFISVYLDIGSFSPQFNRLLNVQFDGDLPRRFGGTCIWHFCILGGGDQTRIGIASDDSFIPHQIVINKFAIWMDMYISSSSCSSSYFYL
jgi:hypothetical protein